jgi:hypothetical protein
MVEAVCLGIEAAVCLSFGFCLGVAMLIKGVWEIRRCIHGYSLV